MNRYKLYFRTYDHYLDDITDLPNKNILNYRIDNYNYENVPENIMIRKHKSDLLNNRLKLIKLKQI